MQFEPDKEGKIVLGNYYIRASRFKRFANYIIDGIVFYLVLIFLFLLLYLFVPSLTQSLQDDDIKIDLLERIVVIILYVLFMAFVEVVFKGKSFGKYITKTRAVNWDGSPITVLTAFYRAFSRAVPLCAFSALGNPCDPWHDRWTETMVIDEKESLIDNIDKLR